MQLCWQMLAPPQSLHSFLRRLCSHFIRPSCGALILLLCRSFSSPPAPLPCSAVSWCCCSSPGTLGTCPAVSRARTGPAPFATRVAPTSSSGPARALRPRKVHAPSCPLALRPRKVHAPSCPLATCPGACDEHRGSAQALWKGPQAHSGRRWAGAPPRASPHTRQATGWAALPPPAVGAGAAGRARVYMSDEDKGRPLASHPSILTSC